MAEISIDSELCAGCFLCSRVCPCAVFCRAEGEIVPRVGLVGFCIGCGHCVSICSEGAIIHSDYPESRVVPLNPELCPSGEQLMELMRSRRSIRNFKDLPVPNSMIETLIEAGRTAPSAHNDQTVEYVVVSDPEVLKQVVVHTRDFLGRSVKTMEEAKVNSGHLNQFRALYIALLHGIDMILFNAPVLLVLHGRAESAFAETNSHLAIANIMLMARAIGLGGFYTGFVILASRESNEIATLLKVPPAHRVHCGLTLGYPVFNYPNHPIRKHSRVTWLQGERPGEWEPEEN